RPSHGRGPRDDLADRGLLRRRARPVAADRQRRRRRRHGRDRRGPAADGAQRAGRIRPRRHRDLRQAGPAVPALRPPRAVEWAGGEQPSDILVPRMPDMTPPARTLKRIGHKGADLIAPGNTIESFDAALAAGVDMVEFDVLPEDRDGSGRLVLAHDYEVVDRGD